MALEQPRHMSPPLPVWPRPLPHEPAHGYFKRLALMNGQISVRSLATSFGLNARNPVPEDFLPFCLEFPLKSPEGLIAATPTLSGNFVTLAGEIFRKHSDFYLGQPRVCGACLAEAPYYRNWFDIAVVDRCPIHDRPLVRSGARSALTWWFPEVGVTPAGESLVELGVEPVALQNDWEWYVLGRIGVLDRFAVPALDEHPIFEIIQVADVLGCASLLGWRSTGAYRFRKTDARRPRAVALAFEMLAGGKVALKHFLQFHTGGRPRRRGDSVEHFYGVLHDAVRFLPDTRLRRHVQQAMIEVGLDQQVVSRKRRSIVRDLKDAPRTLHEVVQEVGLSPTKVREIGGKLGVLVPCPTRNQRHWITLEDAQRIKDTVSGLLSRADAAGVAGYSLEEFNLRSAAGQFQPFVRLGGKCWRHDRFLREHVEARR